MDASAKTIRDQVVKQSVDADHDAKPGTSDLLSRTLRRVLLGSQAHLISPLGFEETCITVGQLVAMVDDDEKT